MRLRLPGAIRPTLHQRDGQARRQTSFFAVSTPAVGRFFRVEQPMRNQTDARSQ